MEQTNYANSVPRKKWYKKWWVILIAVFVVLVIFLIIVGESGNKSGLSSRLGTVANSPEKIASLKSKVNKDLTYDMVNGNPDNYKGQIVQWGARVFTSPERDNNSVNFQAYEGGEDRNFAVIYAMPDFQVKEDDYVLVTGKVLGKFGGENAFGAKLEIPAVEAGYIEAGTRNDVVAPATETIPINDSNTQNSFTVTLDRAELAENETRFFIKLKNDSNDKVRMYDFDSKLTQGSKQYEPESLYDSDQELPSEILPGIEAEGMIVFPAIDPSQKQLTLFLDKPSSDNYDLDWKEVTFNVNLP